MLTTSTSTCCSRYGDDMRHASSCMQHAQCNGCIGILRCTTAQGVAAVAIHGSKDQEERDHSIRQFKLSEKDVLVRCVSVMPLVSVPRLAGAAVRAAVSRSADQTVAAAVSVARPHRLSTHSYTHLYS
jgi:hypothetical protein